MNKSSESAIDDENDDKEHKNGVISSPGGTLTSDNTPPSDYIKHPDPILCPPMENQRGGGGGGGSSQSPKRMLWSVRIASTLLILIVLAIVIFIIFRVTHQREIEQFETEYHVHANNIIATFESNLLSLVRVMDHLGVSASSQARTASTTWPFVTIPEFNIQGESARNLAKANLLAILPLVTNITRQSWEDYSVLHIDWLTNDYWNAPTRGSAAKVLSSTNNHGAGGGGGRSLNGILPATDSLRSLGTIYSNDDDKRTSVVEDANSKPTANQISNVIYSISPDDQEMIYDDSSGPYFPMWQVTPSRTELVNYNVLSHDTLGQDLQVSMASEQVVFGRVADVSNTYDPFHFLNRGRTTNDEKHSNLRRHLEEGESTNDPLSMAFLPIYDNPSLRRQHVGVVVAAYYWVDLFKSILPTDTEPIIAVIDNNCDKVFSISIIGDTATVIGFKDYHDSRFDDLVQRYDISYEADHINAITYSGVNLNLDYCPYSVRVYPTIEMEDSYRSKQPFIYFALTVSILLFTLGIFCIYSALVQKRQTQQVVSQTVKQTAGKKETMKASPWKNQQQQSKDVADVAPTPPTGDFFPHTTVMVADIVGFAAWSSKREPNVIFSFLESVHSDFNSIASKRKVFNVDLIGERFVAVTGLLDSQDNNHALVMTKFAGECLVEMEQKKREFEGTLGAEIRNLALRIGLHSGPVTAGILKGTQNARFQVFGDTVNVACAIEHSGNESEIHCSQVTADLLHQAGKGHWVVKRDDIVQAKGIGEVQTYWIQIGSSRSLIQRNNSATAVGDTATPTMSNASLVNTSIESDLSTIGPMDELNRSTMSIKLDAVEDKEERQDRLVDWYVDLLTKLLMEVAATRPSDGQEINIELEETGGNPVDELVDSIAVPRFDTQAEETRRIDRNVKELDPQVAAELKDYVATIACMYRDNPFHDFEHSSHVSMSALKLLKRIATAVLKDTSFNPNLHTCALGIMEDALAHFAIVFSTLIHDVDHYGVSNHQLIQENADLAILYKNKSIAEQNAIDLSWDLLMEPSYEHLRNCICHTQSDFNRFRNLVVNSVLATDLFDKELTESRKGRFEKAFLNMEQDPNRVDVLNLKVTVLVEYIMQASDIAHTMQHWYVYEKWNERLFHETYGAYKSGRGGKTDPSTKWYTSELCFYDDYVLPLANKMKKCGVFGVWGEEYLKYATANRTEWASKGRSLVQTWVSKYNATDLPLSNDDNIFSFEASSSSFDQGTSMMTPTTTSDSTGNPFVVRRVSRSNELPTINEQEVIEKIGKGTFNAGSNNNLVLDDNKNAVSTSSNDGTNADNKKSGHMTLTTAALNSAGVINAAFRSDDETTNNSEELKQQPSHANMYIRQTVSESNTLVPPKRTITPQRMKEDDAIVVTTVESVEDNDGEYYVEQPASILAIDEKKDE